MIISRSNRISIDTLPVDTIKNITVVDNEHQTVNQIILYRNFPDGSMYFIIWRTDTNCLEARVTKIYNTIFQRNLTLKVEIKARPSSPLLNLLPVIVISCWSKENVQDF